MKLDFNLRVPLPAGVLLQDRAAGMEHRQIMLRYISWPFALNWWTARSAWIEYKSENDLKVIPDGETMLVKQFRIDRRSATPR